MKDLRELLPDYALGLLQGEEKAQLEQALQSSPVLRQELLELQAVLLRLPEGLPPVAPSPRVWAQIQQRAFPKRKFLPWVAAALVLLGLGLGGWGVGLYQHYQALVEEQAKVTRWLADPEVKWQLIKNSEGQAFGTMLWREEGPCLMVLREPPPAGKVYQAWGRKSGADPVSLGVFSGRVFETDYEGFDFMGVSLEPPGGSPQPTEPLGRVPTS
ncbi:MAG: anti-sigma factor [Meiothermus sp.]|nr:anti-sigma factor [Meiothermus sp.]